MLKHSQSGMHLAALEKEELAIIAAEKCNNAKAYKFYTG